MWAVVLDGEIDGVYPEKKHAEAMTYLGGGEYGEVVSVAVSYQIKVPRGKRT